MVHATLKKIEAKVMHCKSELSHRLSGRPEMSSFVDISHLPEPACAVTQTLFFRWH